jgi:hypothetical protein
MLYISKYEFIKLLYQYCDQNGCGIGEVDPLDFYVFIYENIETDGSLISSLISND